MTTLVEASARFACFGSTCAVHVLGPDAGEAVERARAELLDAHARFTRFTATSELAQLNASPAVRVRVSAEMARFVAAAIEAAHASRGLVVPTLGREIERAGYATDQGPDGLPLELALHLAPARRPATGVAPPPIALSGNLLTRPPGVAFDGGGIVKGLLADVVAESLADADAFAIDCAGDLRIGGAAGRERELRVASPFDGTALHTFRTAATGVATSGIGKRSWLRDGRPMHHLLDPSTGAPAFTGVVQATALAPSAVEAEWRAKAAVLSGPLAAPDQLPHGGVLVFDDRSHLVLGRDAP